MTKQTALDFIRDRKGYTPYVTLFDHFEDAIPEYLIELSLHKHYPGGTTTNEDLAETIRYVRQN